MTTFQVTANVETYRNDLSCPFQPDDLWIGVILLPSDAQRLQMAVACLPQQSPVVTHVGKHEDRP